MTYTPVSNSSTLLSSLLVELEKIWRDSFLEAAPLYSAASKVKLPYEDLKTTTTLYHGSLMDEVRPVEQIADYRTLKESDDHEKRIKLAKELGAGAGACVDALIRLENGKHRDGGDIRDTSALRVIDIFEHTDGRRNLNFMVVDNAPLSVVDPARIIEGCIIEGWIAYRFYFACARIRQEYKHSTTKSL